VRILILFIFIFSCNPIRNSSQEYGRDISGASEDSLEFSAAKELIDSRCLTCHDEFHKSWKNYSSQSFIDSGYAIPGQPNNSRIYKSLFDGGINDGVSSLMPKGDSEFNDEEKKIIYDWIVSTDKKDEPPVSSTTTTSTKPTVTSEVDGTDEFKRFYNLVEQKCIWCHDTNDKYENTPNFRLHSADLWLDARSLDDDAPLIVDNDKDGSRFYETIADGTMPPSGLTQLSANEVKIVEDFIASASVTTTTSTTTSSTTTTTRPNDTTTTSRPVDSKWIAARGVIVQRCSSCHDGRSFNTAGINDMTGDEFSEFGINENYINKGNAAASIFYRRTKIDGKAPDPDVNTNMPTNLNGDLSADEGNILADWINAL